MKHSSLPWNHAVHSLSTRGEGYVLVTLLGVRGSTPRDSGTKMVVTEHTSYDTIGGGHLEYKALQRAKEMLQQGSSEQQIEHFPLGPALGQCCGGSTSVLFEAFEPVGVNLVVFGAGHVAHALFPILSELPCRVKWIDSRANCFPESLNHNVTKITAEFPVDHIKDQPTNSYFLVMTHNHQLDFELCEAVLKRNDFAYLGLIASETKWARFKKRFDFKNIPSERVAKMSSPVGLSSVPGKMPMEVAVSIAGEIIQRYQQATPKKPTQQGMHWQDLKDLMTEAPIASAALNEKEPES